MGVEEVMKLVVEKLKEALLAVENWGAEALGWFDDVFPPETRGDTVSHWFHVALPWIIAAVVLTVVICLCRCCCKCCCGGGGGRVRMMKAPGRNCRMPRSAFESNPRGYFRNLRAHPGDQLC
ncbi:hypothetical protein C2S51_035163 [Perilla frutescens var. frutescens]|nr:hypothetical protein C2S51_035163 [Perilla frutescens var. frutescens]